MQLLTIDDFADWLGRECQVTAPDGEVAMTLLAAEPIGQSQRDGGGFRLEFQGPLSPILQQATMTVAGPSATHDIFMVPIGQDPQGTRYEAIFY